MVLCGCPWGCIVPTDDNDPKITDEVRVTIECCKCGFSKIVVISISERQNDPGHESRSTAALLTRHEKERCCDATPTVEREEAPFFE